jgi:hypothetical protein
MSQPESNVALKVFGLSEQSTGSPQDLSESRTYHCERVLTPCQNCGKDTFVL